jgi:hypothetical protein
MTNTQRLVGKNLYVGLIDGSGTVNLSGDFTSFSHEWEQETADMTASADGTRYFAATVKNSTASLETMYLGSAGTANYGRVEPGDSGTLVWGPEGSAAGKPKWTMPVLVTKVSLEQPFDEAVKYTIEFQSQGDVVSGHNTAF